jgi:hypothetical protein
MRRAKHGEFGDSAAQEAEFRFGYLYRTIEEHINAFATQAGGAIAVDIIADRVGSLLRLKAEEIRSQLGASELLLEMRENGTSAGRRAGYPAGAAARSALYVPARFGGALDAHGQPRKRHLSKKALKAISDAQRARWARVKAEKEGKLSRRAGWREKTGNPIGRPRKGVGQGVLTPAQRRRGTASLKSYWAAMTPLQRSAEMIRRRAVTAAKKKARAEAA